MEAKAHFAALAGLMTGAGRATPLAGQRYEFIRSGGAAKDAPAVPQAVPLGHTDSDRQHHQ